MRLSLLSAVTACVSLAPISFARQFDLPREVPTDEAATLLFQAAIESWDDGLRPLRGEQLEEQRWSLQQLAGCAPDPHALRFSMEASASSEPTRLHTSYRFQSATDPDREVQTEMSMDYLRLRDMLLDARGDWEVSSDFEVSPAVTASTMLTRLRPPGKSAEPFEIRLWLRKAEWGDERTPIWFLDLLLISPWTPAPAAAAPWDLEPVVDGGIGMPTEAAFREIVELMKEGAYDGLENVKALTSPKKLWDRNGGFRRWGIKPLVGMPLDLEGEHHYMANFGGSTMASYTFADIPYPFPEHREALDAHFELLRGWMAEHAEGWGVDESFDAWSGMLEHSKRFALVPLPGAKVKRVDGQSVPRIELQLRKRKYDSGENWRLFLSCDAMGKPSKGDGTAPWIAELVTGGPEPVPLPPIPATFEKHLVALVADASNGFASVHGGGEALPDDPRRKLLPGEWPYLPIREDRWAVVDPLFAESGSDGDPGALRNFMTRREDERQSRTSLHFSHAIVTNPGPSTRFAVSQRFEELSERIQAALPDWRFRVVAYPDGEAGFDQLLAIFNGLRPDGHPVTVYLERVSWRHSSRETGSFECTGLSLYVDTDDKRQVGYDLQAAWDEELGRGEEPLASAVRVLGDPLAGHVQPGDKAVQVGGFRLTGIDYFGAPGETEVHVPIVRDGVYDELVLERPLISLAEFRDLRQQPGFEELTNAGLSFLATRLDGDELSGLVRDLVDAADEDFTSLPAEYADWLQRTEDRELITVALPLYRSDLAPTQTLIEGLRGALGETFDGAWVIGLEREPCGVYWDIYSDISHWRAYRPHRPGTEPWVELVEVARDGSVSLEVRVHSFSKAARLAHADTPERIWFDPVDGDFEDGRGVAYCYREGLTFDGPFVNGVPNGTGEHLLADGKALINVVYEEGVLRTRGREKFVPDTSVTTLRNQWVSDISSSVTVSNWEDHLPFELDSVSFLEVPEFQPLPANSSYGRTCNNCYGSGTVITSVSVSNPYGQGDSAPWNVGYYHEDRVGQASSYSEDRLVICSYCRGAGYHDM